MDVSRTYCGKHFTVHVTQTIMLYALKPYSDVCQLFLNKPGNNNLEKKKPVNILLPCTILSEAG